MFEQIVKGVLWFVVATYVVATCKTLTLATGAIGVQGTEHVMVKESGRKPLMYPVIAGTDTPMPFSRPLRTSSRVVGVSRLYYAVHGETAIRDSRFPSFWK